MFKFKLLGGTHREGGKTYQIGDVIETKNDLRKLDNVGRKFEVIELAKDTASGKAEGKPSKPAKSKTDKPAKFTADELLSLSEKELREVAEDEEVDVAKNATKEALVKAILGSN